ncbi:MAG: PAS domain-containing protein [Chthoniobacteraceae bacterium]
MPEPFCVLLIEASPGDRFLLREMIEGDWRARFLVTHVAESLAHGIELACSGAPDVALVDLALSDGAGIEVFTRLHQAAPHLPVILLGETDDEDLALEVVHRGAADYLLKSRLDPHLLHRAMRYAIERGRSETALAHERDLLSALLENIPDRIYFKDRESRFIRINFALTHLLGLESPSDAYGKTDRDFYDEAHAAEARADEERVMSTGEPLIGKVEHEILGSGRQSWSLTTKLALRNRRGEIIGTCGISREITAIKEMELALSSERNLLRSVLENLPDSIFLKDRKGRYMLDNPAHWRSLGASGPEDVRGRTVFDFFPDDLAEKFHRLDMEVFTSGRARINHEEQTLDVRGRKRWLLTTKVPWHDELGATLGVLCIARDITEQKESAEKLGEANAELQRSREETLRTLGELQRAHLQLRDMQLQIVEAEKMKTVGRLAAGVAHEVKNPLAVIRLGIEFLRSCHFDETVVQVLFEMADAVDRADAVILGLLDFSAPTQLTLAPIDLNRLIQNAVALVRGETSGGSVEVVCELERRLPRVALDKAKINQVLVNLLTNALHAMPEGGTMTVRTYTKQLTGVGANVADERSENFRVGQTLVVVELDDTGSGIPEDKLPKIFEPFFTTKPTGKGSGLGLSVAKTIIDLHGGTVDLRNLPTRGVRVTLTFSA